MASRHDGLIHGMIMFGLSLAATIVLATLAGGTRKVYVLTLNAGLGWMLFLSLFLGWLAAMGGASTGSTQQHT